MADIRIQNEGTIFLFIPLSDSAKAWWEESCQEGSCDNRFVKYVDHRYAHDIIDGLVEAGFEIEGI